MIRDLKSGDFELNYKDCFSYLKDTKVPVIIRGTNPLMDGSYTIYVQKFMKRGLSDPIKFLKKDIEEKISFTPLSVGAINLPSSVCYVSKLSRVCSPWRYRRLHNSSNLKIFDPLARERDLLRSPPLDEIANFVVLNSWTDNIYATPQEALENVLQSRRLGQAFSPEYYFAINYKNNRVCLFKDRNIVGVVDPQNRVISLKPSAVPLKESLNEFGLVTKELVR